ncbi:MAG: TOBE domain-containing protein [Conexivisphaerales archaeon]
MSDEKVTREKLSPSFTLMFKGKDTSIDQIDAVLLNYIEKEHSLSAAAKKLGISYRNAWDRIKRLREAFRDQLIVTKKGGKHGGSAMLTEQGKAVLKEYKRLNAYLFNALSDRDFWQHASFKLSARNRLKGRVISVKKGNVTSQVKIRVSGESIITSIVSNEAVDDLDIRAGDEIYAIIKATEVILAK